MKLKLFFIFLIFLIILSVSCSAIKIHYGNFDEKVYFEPNLQKDFVFIISEAQRSAKVPISLEGAMAQYASVSLDVVSISPGEEKEITVSLNLPNELPEGIHYLSINVKEIPINAPDGAFIIIPGVGAILKIINTDVLQDCSVSTFNARIGETAANIVLNVQNEGIKPINNVYADFSVYDSNDNQLAFWKTESFSIRAIDSKTIESSVNLNNVEPGDYKIEGSVFCAGKELPLSKKVMKRANDIEIIDFRAYKQIDKLRVEFELENIFDVPVVTSGMVWFYENGKDVAHYGLPKKKIDPLSKTTVGISPYLKGLRVPAGTYKLKGVLKFEGRSKSKETVITLTEEDLATEPQTSGFGVEYDAEPVVAKEKQPVAEQNDSSGVAITGKTLIRIIAVLVILIVLLLFLFKSFHKKEY